MGGGTRMAGVLDALKIALNGYINCLFLFQINILPVPNWASSSMAMKRQHLALCIKQHI
jgi:hypothetical protein